MADRIHMSAEVLRREDGYFGVPTARRLCDSATSAQIPRSLAKFATRKSSSAPPEL